jgi:hypothetical protein
MTINARNERDTCAMLAATVTQSRESARMAGWEKEPAALDRLEGRAEDALQRNEFREARRVYSQMIRELANRLKSFLADKGSNSAIDY